MLRVKVKEILKLIPDEILDKIGKEVEVDKLNSQLTGKTVFNAMLLSLAQTNRMSLRMLEKVYNSAIFQQFSNENPGKKIKGTHSSFADRLSKINADYFANIFSHLAQAYHEKMPPVMLNRIYRFDGTLISLTSKLFDGLNCSGNNKKHIKIIVGQKGLIPFSVYFCKEQSESSDDKAFPNAIAEADINRNDIIVFDRGASAAKTYKNLTDSKFNFVCRIKMGRIHKVIATHYEQAALNIGDIISDQIILLKSAATRNFFSTEFRLIKVRDKDDKELWILTNIFNISSAEIAEIYRRRWDIEVLFRFIKQELNLKHFLARNMNGMKVYIYMVLIMAILLQMYKSSNSLTGYKWVKFDFMTEIENEIICDLITIAGGDKNIFLQRFGLL